MSSPAVDIDVKPEKIEEEEKEGGTFHCDLYDMDIVHKIAQEFLPGLGSACIDNTTGGLFSSPASVAVDIRKEMVDYLVQRSENFVAETVVLEAGPNEEISKDPFEIISDFIDDFASSKRNFFSRVSGWVLSERREDNIDDFVQEMEINGFWLLNRREQIAQTLLKNVDFKNLYHCSMSFKSEEELEEHKFTCSFRTMTCTNEGCNSIFSAAQKDHHDSVCPFKILKCEQNCSERIMRREMDRHCITVCPMKLVKCPFYSVGCHSSIPQSTVGQHRLENLNCHLLYVLQVVHKEASVNDLKGRVEEITQLSSPGQLTAARDARSLTYAIKDLEAKLGPLKIKQHEEAAGDSRSSSSSSSSPIKEVMSGESPSAVIESVSSKGSGGEDPLQEKEKLVELPTTVGEQTDSDVHNNENAVETPSVQEDSKESPLEKEDAPEKSDEEKASGPGKDEHVTSSPVKAEERNMSVAALESQPPDNENSVETPSVREDSNESPLKKEDELEKLDEEKASGPSKDEHVTSSSSSSPVKAEEHNMSVAALESQPPNNENSLVSTEENSKESPTGREEEVEPKESESDVESKEAGKEEQHSSSPIKAEEEEHTGTLDQVERRVGSPVDDD